MILVGHSRYHFLIESMYQEQLYRHLSFFISERLLLAFLLGCESVCKLEEFLKTNEYCCMAGKETEGFSSSMSDSKSESHVKSGKSGQSESDSFASFFRSLTFEPFLLFIRSDLIGSDLKGMLKYAQKLGY